MLKGVAEKIDQPRGPLVSKRVLACNFSLRTQEAEKESAVEGLRMLLHETRPGFAVFDLLAHFKLKNC
jgi:hypothetical protein